MKAISKEIRKRQKHFPWLKHFIKEYLRTYPNCKKTLQCLLENIEKEIKELKGGHKKKTKELFETINDLYLHFWWKIHWKQKSLWKSYCNVNASHSYQSSEIVKCFGKLLYSLIYLGINLSQGASDSLWINRVLQVIKILPANDEIVYDALLQLHILKKKYKGSYMEILRHILCSEIILDISEPVVYMKSLMLLRRLKNYIEDEVAKASIISTASRIKPPSSLAAWLSSLKIPIDVNKSIVDQLFKKNSKQVFQSLYKVLIDSENSGLNNVEKSSNFEKKSDNTESDNGNKEETLLNMALGIIDTPNEDTNSNVRPRDEKNIVKENKQIKKGTPLTQLSNKIKKSKKKNKNDKTNSKMNFVENNTNYELQLINTNETANKAKSCLKSQNSSTKSKKPKKKKKSKNKNDNVDETVTNKNNDTNYKKTSKTKSKKSKMKKKPKKVNKSDNIILDNKKSPLNFETDLNASHTFNVGDSILINDEFHTEESSQECKYLKDASLSENILMKNEENKNTDNGNRAIKERLVHSATENQISQPDEERLSISPKISNDKESNKENLHSKLPNLLANYEVYSSSDENNTTKRDVSSCPIMESGDNVLVPDTCQNDFNSFIPFNLDSWIPSKSDSSVSNDDDSLSSDKYPFDSHNVIKKAKSHDSHSVNSNLSFSESAFEYGNDSEVSRDTVVSNDGSQISNKYPYVSLVDIRKNKKLNRSQNSEISNSSLDSSAVEIINDSEVSQDTCISHDGSQISDKYPYVSLVDNKKTKNKNSNKKCDYSDLSNDSSFVEKTNESEISQNTCISNEKSQISVKDKNYNEEGDQIDHSADSNYDPILGNVVNIEVIDISNQTTNNSPCHDLYIYEDGNNKLLNTQDKNSTEENENKNSESSPVESKQFQENNSPCEKHLEAQTQSFEQDLVNASLKIEINSPAKRQRKQYNYNIRKKQKRKKSSDSIKGSIPLKEQKSEDLEELPSKNCNKEIENKDSGSPPVESVIQNKQFQGNSSSCGKRSKARTQSTEQDLVNTSLKTKTPAKRLRKQTNYNTRKKLERKNSCDSIEDFVLPKERKQCQDIETVQGKNCNEENEIKVSKSPRVKTFVQNKQVQEKPPCENHSKVRIRSMKQDLVNTKLKTKINSPKKIQGKQKTNNTRKKQEKRKHSSDSIKELVQLKEGKHSQDSVNDEMYLNDLSTLLPNHGDVETQENETTSPSTSAALNHSDTQDLSQFHQHANTLLEESNILLREMNEKQSFSCSFLANTEEQPCVTPPNENHQNNVPPCPIETVINEYIESELSKVHGSGNNNSGRLSDKVMEKTHAGDVHSVGSNAYSHFQTNSDLVPSDYIESEIHGSCNNFNSDRVSDKAAEKTHAESVHSVGNNTSSHFETNSQLVPHDCFSCRSNFSTPQQNNNQNKILSVSSSTENRSVENEVTRSLLNLSVNDNSQRIAFSANPDQRTGDTNLGQSNFNSSNSTFVVDCNIINDFDSRNSSRAGSSVSGDAATIKVVLNLINTKPENSSNSQNLNSSRNSFLAAYNSPGNTIPAPFNSSGNGFPMAYNSSQSLHPSAPLSQMMNYPNPSFPMQRNNSYFSAPPFFSRNLNGTDTPVDSESFLRISSTPRIRNMVPSYSDNRTNFVSSSKSNGKSSAATNFSRKKQRNAFSHSSESTNEWGINQHDLNCSFSNIPSVQAEHCEEALTNLNNSVKTNHNNESVSRTIDLSTYSDEKTAFHSPRPVTYRNSQSNIYSEESEDNMSISTMSTFSGEETDHSLIKTTDNELSPKAPLHCANNSSKNKKRGSNTLTGQFLIKSADNMIVPKISLHRKNNAATKNGRKKLFREEHWAMDTPITESSDEKQTKVPRKRKPIKIAASTKKPKTSLKREYNLRSRPSLRPPTKLKSYVI